MTDRFTRRAAFVAAVLVSVLVVRAERPTTVPATQPAEVVSSPLPGVEYQAIRRTAPPMSLHIVRVRLDHPGLSLHVSRGGDDPDGDGPMQTTLMPVRQIAERERYDLAINGDFFRVSRPASRPGATQPTTRGYYQGLPAAVLGPAVTDGHRWAPAAQARPVFATRAGGGAVIAMSDALPPDVRHAVAGNVMLLADGEPLRHNNRDRHPRTALGLDEEGRRLTVLVVDGRQATSAGMTYADLAAELQRLGCRTAVNLDGGGSTTLVIRDRETGRLRVVNTPSDRRERPVANVLGLRAGADPDRE